MNSEQPILFHSLWGSKNLETATRSPVLAVRVLRPHRSCKLVWRVELLNFTSSFNELVEKIRFPNVSLQTALRVRRGLGGVCLPADAVREDFRQSGKNLGVPEFWIPNNDADAAAPQPGKWSKKYPLRIEQLRSLAWMKKQESFGGVGANSKEKGDGDHLATVDDDLMMAGDEKIQKISKGINRALFDDDDDVEIEDEEFGFGGGAAFASSDVIELEKENCTTARTSITCDYKRYLPGSQLLAPLLSSSSDHLLLKNNSLLSNNFCVEIVASAKYALCGGLLADKPGHGKTATTIGLIVADDVDLTPYMPRDLPTLPLRGTKHVGAVESQLANREEKFKNNNYDYKWSGRGVEKILDNGKKLKTYTKRTRDRIVQYLKDLPADHPAGAGTLSLSESARLGQILGGRFDVRDYFPALNTTLILVPERLLSQWVGEFKKFLLEKEYGKLRIAQVSTVTELAALRVGDIQYESSGWGEQYFQGCVVMSFVTRCLHEESEENLDGFRSSSWQNMICHDMSYICPRLHYSVLNYGGGGSP